MNRQIVLDTETTGLDPNNGEKIVEIGAIELKNSMFSIIYCLKKFKNFVFVSFPLYILFFIA